MNLKVLQTAFLQWALLPPHSGTVCSITTKLSSLKQQQALSIMNHDWLNIWTTDHYQGKISDLNTQASESNRIIAERDAKISGLSSELAKLTSSTSWKITRPLRFANLFFHAPVATFYNLLRVFYWRMPPLFRQYLQGPRYSFVRWTRKLTPKGSINSKLAGNTISDLRGCLKTIILIHKY